MRSSKKSFLAFVLLLTATLLGGCNAFEAIDSNMTDRSQEDRLSKASLSLDAGNFELALEDYDLLYNEGYVTADLLRGRAYANAGLGGFRLATALNSLQNRTDGPLDNSTALFTMQNLINDPKRVESAISDLSKIPQPNASDKSFYAILTSAYACHQLVKKYDTNFNKRLDKFDEIDFDTNDSKTELWGSLFSRLTATSGEQSLEVAFISLAQGFEGRGDSWLMISPIQGTRIRGLYTPANRSSILAIGDLADKLEVANVYFNRDANLFKQTLISLDGAE